MAGIAPRIDYFTASDGYRIASRVWEADNPIGRIVHVHGMISHGGWYLKSCRHFASQGFEVHFPDRRGSGLNMQSRGDAPGHEVLLDDVEQYLTSLTGNLPTILIGVSWGGKFAAAFARRRPELLAGIVMLCPGLFARQMPSPLQYFGLTLAGSVGLDLKRVTIPLQDPALFTDSERWQNYIRKDPLTLRQITIRFARADTRLTRFVTKSPQKINIPALCILAGRDLIVDNRRVKQFFNAIDCDDKELVEYKNGAHTLEFEPDTQRYFSDVTSWGKELISRLH